MNATNRIVENAAEGCDRAVYARDADTYPHILRLYDDDGIFYYAVQCADDDDAENLFDWFASDSGITNSYLNGIPFIG